MIRLLRGRRPAYPQLIVRTPGGKVGELVDVLIMFEPGGQLRLPGAFTYVVKNPGAPVP